MSTIRQQQHIASLIAKKRLGTITPGEQDELNTWIGADQRHARLYHKLEQQDYTSVFQTYRQIDTEQNLLKYRKQYPRTFGRLTSKAWMAVAAVGILLLSVGGVYWYTSRFQAPTYMAAIQPGSSKATLILDDGSVRELSLDYKAERFQVKGAEVSNSGQQIRYTGTIHPSAGPTIPEEYNTLKIPTGGEYQLILADGSKVWLNSQTTLRYPVNFTGEERRVQLQGEAYFEVAHDAGHPFIVETGHEVKVRVLGTSFNIRDYEDEGRIETVLEEGGVKMMQNGREVILNPGTKATYEEASDRLSTTPVDTRLYTAWHTGHYIFQEQTIETILQKLSRWYDIEVKYADEDVKTMLFSGNIRKYDTIDHFLKALELTYSIDFQIDGRTITVSRVNNNN